MRTMTKLMKLTTLALAATVVAASAPAAAADFYLKFGDVEPASKGGKIREAAARSVAGTQVEVMSWSFGASQSSHAGGGMGAGKVNMQDMSVMRATPVPADYDGDGRVAAADYDGDGRADRSVKPPRDVATGQSSGKRMHQPVGRGSVTLVGKFPACTVGAAYKDAVLQVAALRYKLENVMITSCATATGGTGGEPAQGLSLNYTKIKLD